MKRVISLAVALIASTAISVESTSPNQVQASESEQVVTGTASAAMPLPFTKNMGQWPDSILFRASGNGATMWFTKNGIWYQFFKRIAKVDSVGRNPRGFDSSPVGRDLYGPDRSPDSIITTMVKAEFVGASELVQVVGEGELEYKCNYFIGNQPEKWRTDVPNFSAVTMRGIYPGVDISFTSESGMLIETTDATVAENLSQVRVEYRGAEGLQAEADKIATVQSKLGEHRFEGVLLADNAVTRQERQVASTASSASAVGLVYSTYLGGSGSDWGYSVAVDVAGRALIAGSTSSADFPSLEPFDSTLGITGSDAFIAKFNLTGTSLEFCTYLGGDSGEVAAGLAIDGQGNVFVAGMTASINFPTKNPYQLDQPSFDVFLSKVNSSGDSLIFSTYLGGSNGEGHTGVDVAVDNLGSAYVAGGTYSIDFPVLNPYQTYPGGHLDSSDNAFVSKFSTTGNSLAYSTYLGGSKYDGATAIAVSGAGNAYVVGETGSNDFPVVNALQSYQGPAGYSDGYVTKLSLAGNALVYSTYLGGNARDLPEAITVDSLGRAFVTGHTESINFPSVNPPDSSQMGFGAAFVCALSSSGSNFVYCSRLVGSELGSGNDITVDGSGRAYVTGNSTSSVFTIAVNSGGDSVVFKSILSGSSSEFGESIAIDSAGSVYVTGRTRSSDFPTASAIDNSYNGSGDAFVTKLRLSSCCIGVSGNVDCDPGQGIDISDLSRLIDRLFISFAPLCCDEEGNIDGDPTNGIDISDLTRLIDFLFISFTPPAACQ